MIAKVLILIFLINFVQSYFDVQLDHIEILQQNTKITDWSTMKIRKVNKTRSMVGEIILKKTLDNDVMIYANAYKKQGGEYRLMPYKVQPTPFCDFINNDEYVYPDIKKGSDLFNNGCPVKPGTYKAHNITFSLEKVPKMIVPSGDYAGEVIYERDGEIFLKYRMYATVVAV